MEENSEDDEDNLGTPNTTVILTLTLTLALALALAVTLALALTLALTLSLTPTLTPNLPLTRWRGRCRVCRHVPRSRSAAHDLSWGWTTDPDLTVSDLTHT